MGRRRVSQNAGVLFDLVFNIFLNDMFYFATESDLYNYADDNCVSVSHTEINILSSYLQSETQSMVKWFTDNSMRADADKFQGIILCGGREQKTININVLESNICFVAKIELLGISIDDKLNFNDHFRRICSKASAQIHALQHLTGLIDLPSRKAIYSSFTNFNNCPLFFFSFFLPEDKVLIWLKKFKNGHSDLFSGTKCSAMMSFWKRLVMNPSEFMPSNCYLLKCSRFLMDYHPNICRIYLGNQTILIIWGIRINWFNH